MKHFLQSKSSNPILCISNQKIPIRLLNQTLPQSVTVNFTKTLQNQICYNPCNIVIIVCVCIYIYIYIYIYLIYILFLLFLLLLKVFTVNNDLTHRKMKNGVFLLGFLQQKRANLQFPANLVTFTNAIYLKENFNFRAVNSREIWIHYSNLFYYLNWLL